MKLGGVVIPAAVPVAPGGEPDLAAYENLLEFQIRSGVHGLFVNGSMGGFAFWTDAWQIRIAERAAAVVNGRLPLLAGVSDTSTVRVMERIHAQQHLAVDAFVVMPPYYYLTGQAELARFYFAIADAAPKPVVLYDNPRLCKNGLTADTILELSRHPNVIGIKASSTDVFLWQELLRAPIDRERFALISGAGRMTNLALQLGFDGITEGLHNLVPHLAVQLFEAARRGDFTSADRTQQQINRCFRVFDIAGGWRGLGVALRYLGIGGETAPSPYDLPLAEDERRMILAVLESECVPRADALASKERKS
jgi:dihydrodipicolinate synthase/N-acetylneuraminate lyase